MLSQQGPMPLRGRWLVPLPAATSTTHGCPCARCLMPSRGGEVFETAPGDRSITVTMPQRHVHPEGDHSCDRLAGRGLKRGGDYGPFSQSVGVLHPRADDRPSPRYTCTPWWSSGSFGGAPFVFSVMEGRASPSLGRSWRWSCCSMPFAMSHFANDPCEMPWPSACHIDELRPGGNMRSLGQGAVRYATQSTRAAAQGAHDALRSMLHMPARRLVTPTLGRSCEAQPRPPHSASNDRQHRPSPFVSRLKQTSSEKGARHLGTHHPRSEWIKGSGLHRCPAGSQRWGIDHARGSLGTESLPAWHPIRGPRLPRY